VVVRYIARTHVAGIARLRDQTVLPLTPTEHIHDHRRYPQCQGARTLRNRSRARRYLCLERLPLLARPRCTRGGQAGASEMSRALHIEMDEGAVIARCLAEKVGVSAIERLPQGGVRL